MVKKAVITVLIFMFFVVLTAQVLLPDINYWQSDAAIGWKHTSSFSDVFRSSEFKTKIQFNKEGFRDSEHKINKQKNVLRVAVIGDSFVEGLQVNGDKLLTTILGTKLNLVKNSEVMNFGVSSFGTTNEYLTYEAYVKKYKPDYVVIVFSVNDFIDNDKSLSEHRMSIELMKHRPYFFLDADGGLAKEDFVPFKRNAAVEILRKIKLFSFFRNIMFKLKVKKNHDALRDELNFYGIEYSPQTQASAVLTQKILREFLSAIVNDKAIPLVVLFYPAYVVDTYHKDKLMRNAAWDKIDINKPLNIIEKECRSVNVDVVDMRQLQLSNEYSGGNTIFFKEGHWNERGHELAATTIAQSIISKIASHTK